MIRVVRVILKVIRVIRVYYHVDDKRNTGPQERLNVWICVDMCVNVK